MIVNDDHDGPESRRGPAPLPAPGVDAVSRRLKQGYGKILNEPVPDRFLQLLQQLDAQTPGEPPDDGSEPPRACSKGKE